MDEHQVRLLPVLENHTLIGVISISDVIRHLVQAPVLGTHVVREPTSCAPNFPA
jgi:CBS domain-containing protein